MCKQHWTGTRMLLCNLKQAKHRCSLLLNTISAGFSSSTHLLFEKRKKCHQRDLAFTVTWFAPCWHVHEAHTLGMVWATLINLPGEGRRSVFSRTTRLLWCYLMPTLQRLCMAQAFQMIRETKEHQLVLHFRCAAGPKCRWTWQNSHKQPVLDSEMQGRK